MKNRNCSGTFWMIVFHNAPWGLFTDEEDGAETFVTDGVFSGWFLMFA